MVVAPELIVTEAGWLVMEGAVTGELTVTVAVFELTLPAELLTRTQ